MNFPRHEEWSSAHHLRLTLKLHSSYEDWRSKGMSGWFESSLGGWRDEISEWLWLVKLTLIWLFVEVEESIERFCECWKSRS